MTEIIHGLIEKARHSQKIIEFWEQDQVDEMVVAVGWQRFNHTAEYSQLAFEETGMPFTLTLGCGTWRNYISAVNSLEAFSENYLGTEAN